MISYLDQTYTLDDFEPSIQYPFPYLQTSEPFAKIMNNGKLYGIIIQNRISLDPLRVACFGDVPMDIDFATGILFYRKENHFAMNVIKFPF